MKLCSHTLLFLAASLFALSAARANELLPEVIQSTAESALPPQRTYEFAFTTAVAIPQPLTIGVQAHRTNQPDLDAFYEAGFFKYPLSASTRSGSDYTFEAGLRYHPFANWFYVAGELGFRHIGVNVDISNLKQDGVALANTATLSLGTFFAGFLAGGEWRLAEHFALAFDLGLQLALIHTGSITINADPSQIDGTDNSVDDQKELKRISGLPLPQIAVFRLVWYI